jgi:hypothetical protein
LTEQIDQKEQALTYERGVFMAELKGIKESKPTPLIVYQSQEAKIKKFKGEPFFSNTYIDVEDWKEDAVVALHARANLSPLDQVHYLVNNLEDSAKEEVTLRDKAERDTVDQVFAILEENFGDKRTLGQRQKDFYDYRQGENEKVRDFSHSLLKHMKAIERKIGTPIPDKDSMLKEQFVENVHDVTLRRELRRTMRESKKTFLDLREDAVLWTEEERVDICPADVSKDKPSKKSVKSISCIASADEATPSVTDREFHKLMMSKLEQLEKDIKKLSNRGRKKLSEVECYHCHNKGHYKTDCPKLKADQANGSASADAKPSAPASEN